MGRMIWLVVVAFWTSTQLVPRPTLSALVCACNLQPVWSAGQDNVRLPPLTAVTILVGFVFTTGAEPVMRRNPSVVSVLVSQARPGPGVAGIKLVKPTSL